MWDKIVNLNGDLIPLNEIKSISVKDSGTQTKVSIMTNLSVFEFTIGYKFSHDLIQKLIDEILDSLDKLKKSSSRTQVNITSIIDNLRRGKNE